MSSTPWEQAVISAANIIRNRRRGVVLTGAGISTPSGIPDFRSLDSGLWRKHDPYRVASLTAFRQTPERFFDWIRPLAHLLLQAQPNPAHHSLAKLEAAGRLEAIITQNIDGLLQRAGARTVYEVHGSIDDLTCVACYRIIKTSTIIQSFLDGGIPTCPHCQGTLKPNVILLEEQLPIDPWMKAQEALRACDFLLIAGTSLEVHPVAQLPRIALDNGAPLIIVNRTVTPFNDLADVTIEEDVAVILPRIVEEVLRV